ncbi:cardiac-enriched FHL2-interacting protein [Paroedura picta]|uniref:cardiac-enriched FHL2-interacting protein n=1 Tax=Paroedura picta TaxID=143630 RepID=UPI00101486BE
MQGSKRHTDGQSDTSSIGSLLDETDREVCSLTDRAFKSLCLDELETSDTEAGPVVSPRTQHPFSAKCSQGPRNHAIKRHIAPNKLMPQTEEHSTFQQLPKDAQEEAKAVPNSIPNIRRNLGLPVPNLRHYKHTSKVSSLIKTFDKVENQEAPATAVQPIKSQLPKCPSICGSNMALRGGKMILNIPKELSEFSGACQNVGDVHCSHEMHEKQPNPMDLLCQGPPRLYPPPAVPSDTPLFSISTLSKKIAKKRIGKAKEPAGWGSFLHSENSAFESWPAHHKKLAGMRGPSKPWAAEETLASLEGALCLSQSYRLDGHPSPTETADSALLEQDVSSEALLQNPLSRNNLSPVSLNQSPAGLPTSTARDPLAPLPPPPSAERVPTPLPLPARVSFPQAASPGLGLQDPSLLPDTPQSPLLSGANSHSAADTHLPQATWPLEKTNHLGHDPELETVCPPWRRQKAVIRGTEMATEAAWEGPDTKDPPQGNSLGAPPSAARAPTDAPIALRNASSPSFNLTQLLTPLLPPRQQKEPPMSPLALETAPLLEAEAAKEPEERAIHGSQDNYKSKASSLLFNLKDIRKRVKSTYSPSPLLRAFEDKKKSKEADSLKASVKNILEGSSSKPAGNAEASQKPAGKLGAPQENARTTHLKGHLPGNHRTLCSPPSKSDSPGCQLRNPLQQKNPVDLEDGELVAVAEFYPKDHSPSQCPPASKSEQDTSPQNVSLWDPQNKTGAQSPCADVGSRESPNTVFFTVEERVTESDRQARPDSGTGCKDKGSRSSSEQSLVSTADQPSGDEPFSLMRLFQKACLQESQRNTDKVGTEEQCSDRVGEKPSRPGEASHDHALSECDSNAGGKGDGKVEQRQGEEATLQERLRGERREGRGQSLEPAPEAKSEEPLTPTLSSSFKPNLFRIKDNTFKSPPVIKAVKLPLFRSLSCDGAIAAGYRESEKQAGGPFHTTPVIQETDWPLPRNRRQQRAWRAAAATDGEGEEPGYSPVPAGSQRAEEGKLAAESTIQELRSFYEQQPVADDGRMAIFQGTAQNKDKDSEKQLIRDKEKARTRKLRPSSTSQLHPEGDLAQSETQSPPREKTSYYKNNPLTKRRSGACVKKVISQETGSPTASETPASSPAFSDAFRDTLCTPSLASSTVPSPRSDSTLQSAFPSPLSDPATSCGTAQGEKGAAPSALRHGAIHNEGPAGLPGHPSGSPVATERPQLMRQMVKTAAKPPAVPPKTEKALRRAKKLASRRKKVETQQKKPPADSVPLGEDSSRLSPAQSLLLSTHFSSPVMSSQSNQVIFPTNPSSPTPPSPATQRKLLQDPDSGEYFMVDLPTQFKTLYDPESGRYLQVSLPSSKRDVCQTPSSEVLAPPYVLCPSARVSSVPARASPSQLSEPGSLVQGALSESVPDWQQDGCYPESFGHPPYQQEAASEDHAREADRPPFNYGREVGLPDKTDIISLGAIEDFAVEGIS